MSEKLVIIGGVAAGASAAAKARRENESIEIKIFEKNGYVSFANCGLPYYIGGAIPRRKSLLLHTTKTLGKRFKAGIFVGHEVVEIKPSDKKILIKNESGYFEESYDKLIIATGGKPIIPDIRGLKDVPYFMMRSMEDVDNIKRVLEEKRPKKAIVIGGGFIGVEIAEAMLHCSLEVSLIDIAPHILPSYSPEVVLAIEEKMKQEGVRLYLNAEIEEVKYENDRYFVKLKDGEQIDGEILFLATGVRPNVDLAKNCGIEIGELGGIVTDKFMKTNFDDIYAAGDAVEKYHIVANKNVLLPLAGPANREGRTAGCNAAGGYMENPGVIGTSAVMFFDKVVAKTGLSFEEAVKFGFDADYVYTEDPDHVEYFPGFKYIFLKLVYDKKTKRILGVEGSGSYDTVRKIDVFAAAIYGHLTIYDLENMDFSYAPPLGAARDNVIKAGFTASNQDRGIGFGIKPDEFLELLKNDDSLQVIDVRTRIEYKAYRLEEAVNIYVNEIRDNLDKIDITRPVYVYCAVGFRGYLATRFLRNLGYEAYNILGGIESINRFKKL